MRRAPPFLLIALSACATHREQEASVVAQEHREVTEPVAVPESFHFRAWTLPEPVLPAPSGKGVLRLPFTAAPLPRAPATLPAGVAPAFPFTDPVPGATYVEGEIHFGPPQSKTTVEGASLSGSEHSEKDSKPSLGIPMLGLLLAGIAAAAILTRGIWLGPLASFLKSKL